MELCETSEIPALFRNRCFLIVLLLTHALAMAESPSTSPPPVNPDFILTRVEAEVLDDYTLQPVEGAELTLYDNNSSVQKAFTNSQGIAILEHWSPRPATEQKLSLGTPFPNPAGSSGLVRLLTYLPTAGSISLSLQNLRGELLCVHQQQAAPGFYHTLLEPGGLPEGMYLLTARLGNQISSQRILLLGASPIPGRPSLQLEYLQAGPQGAGVSSFRLETTAQSYDTEEKIVWAGNQLLREYQLSRNNRVVITAGDFAGSPVSLPFTLNGQSVTSPHEVTVKSGFLRLAGLQVPPVETEVASTDRNLVLTRQDLRFVYPDATGIDNMTVLVNGQHYTSLSAGGVHPYTLEEMYRLEAGDERLSTQIDSLLVPAHNSFLMKEKILFPGEDSYSLDLAESAYIEIDLAPLIHYATAEGESWISSNMALVEHQNRVYPHMTGYAHTLELTIQARAVHGTRDSAIRELTVRPVTPRRRITTMNAETYEVQKGYILIGTDTVPVPTGTLEVHTPLDHVVTGLYHPRVEGLKYSYLRTTPVTDKDTIKTYNVDFYLRNVHVDPAQNKKIVDSLFVKGYDAPGDTLVVQTGNPRFTPQRFADFMKIAVFNGPQNKLDQTLAGGPYPPDWPNTNSLKRWNRTLNQITPDTIILYNTYTSREYINGVWITATYPSLREIDKERITSIVNNYINPLTEQNIPVIVKENFDFRVQPFYININTIHNLHITGRTPLSAAGLVTVNAYPDGGIGYSDIILNTNINDTIGIDRVMHHEFASSITFGTMFRARVNDMYPVRIYETVMGEGATGWTLTPTLVDHKVGRITTNLYFRSAEPIENILRMPF